MSKTTMQELARRWVVEHDEAAFWEYCQREAVRLDAEEAMSFAPDLNDCSFAAVQYELASNPEARICRLSDEATHALLAEYQRQLAAAGLVIAQREDSALRERAERLRRIASALDDIEDVPSVLDVAYMYLRQLQPGDLVDDLIQAAPEAAT